MIIQPKTFTVNQLTYSIRSAQPSDAKALSELRLQVDGETENLDREPGEGFIDEQGFQSLIQSDREQPRNLFLVVEVDGGLVAYSRCAGVYLKRSAHKVEFGVAVLQEFWGYGMGKNLLLMSMNWADTYGIRKMNLSVLETNIKAIQLYQQCGFEVEGILRQDKLLADGKYYNTLMMGRISE